MTIIRDVSLALKDILNDIQDLDENGIIFDSPADIETTTTNSRLLIYLYQIVENSHLRNTESEPVGMDQMRHPPLFLDLYYIFVPYASNREAEIMILENLMQIFHDSSVLKAEFLEEELGNKLKKSGNNEIRIIPNNFTFEEINKLWETFPNRDFKLSVSYQLTPIRIPSAKPQAQIKRVMEKNIDMYMMGADK